MVMSQPAYPSAGPIRADKRAADRRRSAAALLTTVTSGLAATRDPGFARERFEQELCTIVRARSVSLCGDPVLPVPPDTMCFDLPATHSAQRGRLEIRFDAARTLDGWTCQVLEAATHVAALLLEIDRVKSRGAPPRQAGDGAAPLIGSGQAIRAVRERIERVAATDFTVLIEGASGPQPHPSFIEVSDNAALG